MGLTSSEFTGRDNNVIWNIHQLFMINFAVDLHLLRREQVKSGKCWRDLIGQLLLRAYQVHIVFERDEEAGL